MSAVSGLLSSFQATPNDLTGEWQETVFVRNSKGRNTGSTLFGLMSQLEAEGAANIEFNWWERDPVRIEVTINHGGGYLSTDTQLVFDDGAGNSVFPVLGNGHILRSARTGEYLQLTSDPTTDTVTVLRGFGGTSAAAINDNDIFVIVTLGKQEGALPSRSAYEQPEIHTNYIQTFNAVVELTNAYMGGELRTDIDGPLDENRVQALERVANQIEFAYFLGIRAKQTVGGNNYQYYTGGIWDALNRAGLTQNILNGLQGTGVTLDVFNAWVESYMTVGSDTKLAFCGPKSFAAVSRYANNASAGYRIMQNETIFGMNITTIQTPFGELSLAFHPLFRETTSLNDWMFVVDLMHVKQKTFEPLFLEPNIQLPGSDSYKEQYRAKLGLKLRFANAFGVAYGLQKILPNS